MVDANAILSGMTMLLQTVVTLAPAIDAGRKRLEPFIEVGVQIAQGKTISRETLDLMAASNDVMNDQIEAAPDGT